MREKKETNFHVFVLSNRAMYSLRQIKVMPVWGARVDWNHGDFRFGISFSVALKCQCEDAY